MNNLFFTITKENNQINFSAQDYNFTIPESEQRLGTKGNALWYYQFDELLNHNLKWLSWNQKSNETKSWEYLLIDINGILHSGFINKSRTQNNIYYCNLNPLPPKPDFEIIY